MTASSPYQRLTIWFESSGAGAVSAHTLPLAPLCAEYGKRKHDAFNLPIKTAGNVDVNKFNPLSKVTTGNPWTAQYENQNRVNEIKLDVDRTYQDMPFFRSPVVQGSLINVLFVFGKGNSLQYRQGMNEICALIYHVVSDGIGSLSELPVDDDPVEVKEALTYAIFSALMLKVGVADFFYTHSVVNPPPEPIPKTPSPLLERCNNIFDLLCQKDARLHKHLVMKDISPNLFLLRWVRLLFSREFSFTNTLVLWDYLFGNLHEGKRLAFPSVVDCVAIAMLLHVKQSLLSSDNSGCFTLLLKYPEPSSMGTIIDAANRLLSGGEPVSAAPQVVSPPPQSKRDRVVTDLTSVIDDLRNSEVSGSIQREIAKLEDLVNFLKPK